MKEPALYSLVQYVEHLERDEGVNVGVLLEAHGHVLKRFVQRSALNGKSEIVDRFEHLFERIIEEGDRGLTEDADTLDKPFIWALSQRRFPHFRITEPRQIMIEPTDLDGAVAELCHRLVEDEAPVPSSW
jgi:hypothetical protein